MNPVRNRKLKTFLISNGVNNIPTETNFVLK